MLTQSGLTQAYDGSVSRWDAAARRTPDRLGRYRLVGAGSAREKNNDHHRN